MKESVALVALLSGWTLWHDVGIYQVAGHRRLGGPSYAVTAYATETDCQTAQQVAMANEERSRRGPLAERLSDGILVWDPSREHYTTFRYRCAASRAQVGPIPMTR